MENEIKREKVFDVLIIGMGPVGLYSALSLAKLGWEIGIIDKLDQPPNIPRAIHIDDETLRYWVQVIDKQDTLALFKAVSGMRLIDYRGNILLETRKISVSGFPASNLFYSPDFERLMLSELDLYANIHTFFKQELIHIQSLPEIVNLQTRDRGGDISIFKGKYTLGCDGANSTVRKLLKLPLKTFHYQNTHLKLDFLKSENNENRTTDQPVNGKMDGHWIEKHCRLGNDSYVVLHGIGNHIRWEYALSKKEQKKLQEDPAYFKLRVNDLLDNSITNILHSSVYHCKSAVARNWNIHRTFLLGDAAHQMPPYIGQGMCAGIHDSTNLCWKLHFVLLGLAHPSLLSTYQKERVPHVVRNILLTILTGQLYVGWLTLPLLVVSRIIPLKFRTITAKPFRISDLSRKFFRQITGKMIPQLIAKDDPYKLDELLGTRFAIFFRKSINVEKWKSTVLREISNIEFVFLELDKEKQVINQLNDNGKYTAAHPLLTKWFIKHDLAMMIVRPDKYIWDAAREEQILSACESFKKCFHLSEKATNRKVF